MRLKRKADDVSNKIITYKDGVATAMLPFSATHTLQVSPKHE